ncbi:MAG: hypothetical protein PVH19_15045 [Planctomycetia bacterium]|jgi:hypothetical protein
MKTFKDNADRSWTITINVAAIKRVRSLLDVNLMEAVEGDLLERLATDPILLCDVVYVLCKPEADNQGVTDEQFGQAMAGDAIEHATTALLEELVDFFPLAKRRVLQKALTKLKTVEEKAAKFAEAALNDPKFDEQIDAALSDITDSVLSLRESLVSTPANTPSAS